MMPNIYTISTDISHAKHIVNVNGQALWSASIIAAVVLVALLAFVWFCLNKAHSEQKRHQTKPAKDKKNKNDKKDAKKAAKNIIPKTAKRWYYWAIATGIFTAAIIAVLAVVNLCVPNTSDIRNFNHAQAALTFRKKQYQYQQDKTLMDMYYTQVKKGSSKQPMPKTVVVRKNHGPKKTEKVSDLPSAQKKRLESHISSGNSTLKAQAEHKSAHYQRANQKVTNWLNYHHSYSSTKAPKWFNYVFL